MSSNSDNEPVWEEPPRRVSPLVGRGAVQLWIARLRDNPGSWAVRQYKTTSAANSTAWILRKQHEEFEFTVRGDKLYGRYNPGKKPAETNR